MSLTITEALVTTILSNPHGLSWRAYGLGLLRLDLSRELKLHIWDDNLSVPNVTRLHTHPWGFTSFVIFGMLKQRRFIRWQEAKAKGIPVEEVHRYMRATIRCGVGACATSEPEEVGLVPLIEECYHSGAEYHQTADEIHLSYPENGTVAIIRRAPFQDKDDSATVFWQPTEYFVSAEPRPATADEIEHVTRRALAEAVRYRCE